MNTYFKIVLIVLGMLCIPLVAMQFTDQVVWKLFDFVVAGVLLFCCISLLVFLYKRFQGHPYRYFMLILCFVLFLLLWAEMAVGIFEPR